VQKYLISQKMPFNPLFNLVFFFFVNHVLRFKFLAKRMSYVKVDCSHLNPDAKRLAD